MVTWFAIQLLIVFGILFNWALCQVDFAKAYPQVPIKIDMYMELPTGIHTKHGNSKDHIFKLLANIYGKKQAEWNSYLVTKLWEINFKQSLVDDWVFYWDDVIFIVYVNNWIFLNSYMTSSTSYVTSCCLLKIKAPGLIMLELVSRNSRTASSNWPKSLNQLHHFWHGAERLQGQGCTSQG